MNITPIYDHFMHCWFVFAYNQLSLVVGWFEVEQMGNLRFFSPVLREEGAWVVITVIIWIARPCVAYWEDSTKLCYVVHECAMYKPLSPQPCYMTNS